MGSINPILDTIRDLVIQDNGNSFVQLEKIVNDFRSVKVRTDGTVIVGGKRYLWGDANAIACYASDALECLKERNAGAYLDGSYHEKKIDEILQRIRERNKAKREKSRKRRILSKG